MDPVHLRLAEIGLRVAARYGFALAGGYAVQAHGILDRPSEDVDLFTAWDRRDEFDVAVNAVVNAFRDGGYRRHRPTVRDIRAADRHRSSGRRPSVQGRAGRELARPPSGHDGRRPVRHIDDVVAGKMSALYTRAEPRDFLDVDAAITTGRYTRERLCELAEQADTGFDRAVLANLFAMLERYSDRRFATYHADSDHVAAMKERYKEWRQELLNGESRPTAMPLPATESPERPGAAL